MDHQNFHSQESKGQYFFKSILFAVLYLASANFGLMIATINNNVTPIWPPTGLAFAIIFLYGRKYWYSIAIGAFTANAMAGNSLSTIIPITVGNTLEAIAGVWIFHRLSRQTETFGNHARSLAFITSAALASIISSSMGVTSLAVNNVIPWDKFGAVMLTWWSGDALGGTIFFPLLLSFHSKTSNEKNKYLTYAAIISSGALLSWPILLSPEGTSYLFLFFPYLYFSATSGREKGLSLAIATLITVSFFSLRSVDGAFHVGTTNAHLINLQLFQLTLAVTGLFLSDFLKTGYLKSPSLVLFSGWLMSGLLFAAFYNQNLKMTDSEFTNVVEKVEASLKSRMEVNVIALKSGAGLFAGSAKISDEEWQNFCSQLNLDASLHGLLGLGKITIVEKKHSKDYILMKRRGKPDFKIHSLGENPLPQNYVIELVQPYERNKKAIGLDVASEIERRAAAETARDTGLPAITNPITLVQVNQKEAGFLLFYPLYSKGKIPSTLDERRARIEGWIYSPVLMKDFFASVFSSGDFKLLTYSISPLHDTKTILVQSKNFTGINKDHLQERVITLFNQSYKLTIGKTPGYLTEAHTIPFWVATAAALFTIGFAAFVVNSKMLGTKANELAEKMTRQLKTSEEKLKIIFDSSQDVHFLVSRNKDGRLYCISVNSTHEKMSGIPNAEYLGKPLDYFLPSEVYASNLQWYEQARLTGLPVRWEVTNEYPTGTKHLIFTLVAVKPDSAEELYVGTIHDITERKNAEELLKQQQLKLTLSAKMSSLGEMAGGIAHEINNPLTIINSKAAILKRNLDKGELDIDKIKKDLTKIEETSNRIAKIIRSLRSFSRNTEGDPMEPAKVSQIIEDTLELCAERFKHHSISLNVNIQTNAMINCRPHQITQVVMNLLSNAHDAIEALPEKWINIDVNEYHGRVIISVTDSGLGIPSAILEKIMNPFFTTKDVGKGTGLGLSISKGIVEDHFGHLQYTMNKGHTCFRVDFPVADVKSQNKAA